MNTNAFSESFCASVTSALEKLAPLGKAASAQDVCDYLGLEKEYKALVGMAVCKGGCPGYTIAKGRGIFREDNPEGKLTRAGTATKEATPKEAKEAKGIDEAFVASLAHVLGNMATGSSAVSRRLVAHNMGRPGSDTELLISAALKAGALPGWASKPGRGGGIYRLETLSPSDEPSSEEPSSEASSEEAAPVKSSKRGKRKGGKAASDTEQVAAAE